MAVAKPEVVIVFHWKEITSKFQLPILYLTSATLNKAGSSSNESGVPENLVLAAGISLISQLVSELQVLPVLRPPYWNLRHNTAITCIRLPCVHVLQNYSYCHLKFTFRFFLSMFLKLSKICGFSAAILNFRYNKARWDVDTYTIENSYPKTWGSRWNFVSRWHRTRDTLGVFL